MKVPPVKIYFPEQDRLEILEKLDGILQSGRLTLGDYTKEFEEKFSSYNGSKYAVAVNSGTSALEIILRSLDVKGSSVIVPTNTFLATAFAVIHAGADVIFADCGEDLNLDPENIEAALKPDTKGVVLVHIGGNIPAKLNEIQDLCEDKNLFLVEDAAHAHGSTIDDKKAGTLGIAGGFSFYPTKVITSGEGGIITTDNEDIYNRALVFRDQGKAGFTANVHTELGYNWRMSELHAVLGMYQLSRLDEFITTRQKIAQIYDESLSDVKNIQTLPLPANMKSNYYKYIAILDSSQNRQTVKQTLREKHDVFFGGEVYELPCHLQPVFKDLYGLKEGMFPKAEDLCARHVCLPMFATMTEAEANHVVASIKEVV
ncbi:MAG: DegT/DnrJ/EryC1/StrS family aminotransferase [Thermoplasmata archaeon]|nr:MAG: DegT/DnrJ/EryC1/StrS family aminotransferase [Thermoplasmata archaeon]